MIRWMSVVLHWLRRVPKEGYVAPVGLVTWEWQAKGLHMETGYLEVVPGAYNLKILNIGSLGLRSFERIALVAILTLGCGEIWRGHYHF